MEEEREVAVAAGRHSVSPPPPPPPPSAAQPFTNKTAAESAVAAPMSVARAVATAARKASRSLPMRVFPCAIDMMSPVSVVRVGNAGANVC